MYNYDGTLIAVFSLLFCLFWELLLAFPQFYSWMSLISISLPWEKYSIGWRGEAAVATFVRELLFVVPHDRQDILPSRTFSHHLLRLILPPPSKFCVCLNKKKEQRSDWNIEKCASYNWTKWKSEWSPGLPILLFLGVLPPKTIFLAQFWAKICWYKPWDL